jgi:hypothetical protein
LRSPFEVQDVLRGQTRGSSSLDLNHPATPCPLVRYPHHESHHLDSLRRLDPEDFYFLCEMSDAALAELQEIPFVKLTEDPSEEGQVRGEGGIEPPEIFLRLTQAL